MIHAAVALGLQGVLEAQTDVHRLAVPRLNRRGKCRLIYVCRMQLILIGIAAGLEIKCTGVLYPSVLLDAKVFVAAVVPAEFTVIVLQAYTVCHLTGFTNCHAEHVRRAPAKANALDHQRVVIRNGTLAVQINILLGQLGNAALGGACARQICPYHTGHGILRGIAAAVRNFQIIALAVQNQCLLAVVIRAVFRLAMNIRIVAVARLVLDNRHALNGAFYSDGLRLCIADGYLVIACFVKRIRELCHLGFTGFQGILLAVLGLTVYLKFCVECTCIVADVVDVCLDVQYVAGRIADILIALLDANIGIICRRLAIGDIDIHGLVSQLQRMLAKRFHAERAAQGCRFARIQRDNAVLKLIQIACFAIVVNRNDSCCQSLAHVGHGCLDCHFTVVQNFCRLNGNIRPFQLLLFLCNQRGVGELAFCAFAGCAVVFNLQNVRILIARDIEEITLLVVGSCVLMRQVNGACADFRIGRYGTCIAVRMTGNHQINLARLDDVRNVPLGVCIGYRMVHHNHAEIRLGCSVGFQICLEPIHGVFNGLERCFVSLCAGSFRVHLEQTPRVAVHRDDVNAAVVERAVALYDSAVFLILNRVYIRVKVYAALIMVAAGIHNRIAVDKIIVCLALEPEAELLCLCTGAFYHVTTVQHNIRIKFLDCCIQLVSGRKNVRVRQGNHANLARIAAQRPEARGAGLAIFQLDLVVIPRASLQIVQLVMEQIHLCSLKIRCIFVHVYRDWIAQSLLVRAICDGRGHIFCAFPYDDHTVFFWCKQVRAVFELGADIIRLRNRRKNAYDHDDRQEHRLHSFEYFTHSSFSPL